jgi:hypothetical protein
MSPRRTEKKCAASVVPKKEAVGIYVLFTTSVIKRLLLRHSEQHKAVKEYVVSALIVIKRNVAKIFELQERREK